MTKLEHTVRLNEIHPYAAYINKINSNVKEQVLQVKSEYPNHHLILRAMNDDNIKDYLNVGFIEFRRTYEQDIKIDDLIDFVSTYKCNNAMSKFSVGDALIEKSFEVYKETHKANPVKEMNLDEWETLLVQDLDYEHSIVLYDEMGKIEAFLIMYDATVHSKDIGYIYFSDAASKTRLYSALYIKLIQLKKKGITEVSVEVDNTDRYAYEFFESLIIHDESYMRTLILNNKLENITFSSLGASQVESLYTWSQNKAFSIANDWPQNRTIEEISLWWTDVIKQQSDTFKRYTIYYRDVMIGYYDVVLQEVDAVELGIAIGETSFRNIGLGSLIFSKITKNTMFDYPGRNIIGITHNSNITSQRMMIKSGYLKSPELGEKTKQDLTFIYIE